MGVAALACGPVHKDISHIVRSDEVKRSYADLWTPRESGACYTGYVRSDTLFLLTSQPMPSDSATETALYGRCGQDAIADAHTHPSGSCVPSSADSAHARSAPYMRMHFIVCGPATVHWWIP